MVRSLLDGADLPALRRLATGGTATAVAVALVDSGLLHFDPDDASWDDRDRVIVCGEVAAQALRERLRDAGADPSAVLTVVDAGGEALALALGAAVAGALDGGAWRTWCVFDAAATDDGRVWEVAAAAPDAAAQTLGVVVAGDAAAPLWRACGWRVHHAAADDPVEMLGGLDQIVVTAPAVLLAVGDD